MTDTPPNTPPEKLAATLRALTHAVVTQGLIGRIASAVVGLLVNRFRETHRAFTRLAALIEAGTFRPRRYAPRRRSAGRKPPSGHPITRKFGWLAPLVPEAPAYRGYLEHFLQDPETVALLEAAPAAMARMLRPICWALGMKPPSVLATSRRRPPAAPAARPQGTLPPPARPPTQTTKPRRAPRRRPARQNSA